MLYVNNSFGIEVPLDKKTDDNGRPFYIGRLQFNGTLDLNGSVFMVFNSEPGYEMLQISCLADKNSVEKSKVQFGPRTKISLEGFKDNDKQVVFIAKVKEDRELNAQSGIFFTVFTSIEGREEIQITPLKYKATQKKEKILCA